MDFVDTGLATGDRPGCCVSDVRCHIPAADCRSGFVGVGFELPPHGGNQCLFAMDRRSLQHARCSSVCPAEWGRVHEVRRPSMPKLGALIQIGLAGLRYTPRLPGRLLGCCSLHRFPGVARCASASARSEGYPAGSVCSSTLGPLDAFSEGARRMALSWPVPELAWGSNLLLALCRCRDRSARFPSM